MQKCWKEVTGLSVQYVAEMYVDLGEKIHVRSLIKPKCNQEIPFTIRTARWELYDSGGNIEDFGDCIITDHMIDAFVNPQKIGTYKLKYIYEIADETWVDNVRLKVN